ncbi:MAG: hypothetical protein GY703_05505 [Gammaproteobacteria bacterium]|nr:hypothetical protein [Gammaproteobacteria bacterium]
MTDAEFVDGRLIAGLAARRVKNNQEMKQEPGRMELLIQCSPGQESTEQIDRSYANFVRMWSEL